MTGEKKEPTITIRGAEQLNVTVREASLTVVDEKGKILYEKRRR